MERNLWVSGLVNVFCLIKDGSVWKEPESGEPVFTTLNRDA